MSTEDKVREYIAKSGIASEFRVFNSSTKSSERAARSLGCGIGQIAKSIVFRGTVPVIVIISGKLPTAKACGLPCRD